MRLKALAACLALPLLAFAFDAPPAPRVEARSEHFLAVGVVQGERMSIHVSRVSDNSPLHDAVVGVVLRGAAHPTLAEADGSYTLTDKDLSLPGSAAVVFEVEEGGVHETLKGSLSVAAASGVDSASGTTRQNLWWLLNFAACGGFLWLLSRRKKKEPAE